MDYKEKYEQLEKFIKDLYSFMSNYCKEKTEGMIPELKESEDEKIRKELLAWLKNSEGQTLPIDRYNAAVAWLEKQGEKIDKLVKYREWLINETERWTEKENNKTNSNAGKHCCIGAANALISARTKFEEIFDYESWHKNVRDKVEPKFKVDDWITNGACTIQITSVDDMLYWHDNDCIGGDIESIDKQYHLWTIEDAKDGDVLACGKCILIFDQLSEFNNEQVLMDICHCTSKRFYWQDTKDRDLWVLDGFKPATKEQRDALFAKMHEAGYEWDAEKKELKKIKQNPAEWSEEDEKERKRVVGLLEGWLYTFKETCYAEDCKCGIAWLKSLKERMEV